jgi:hypothetical protein
LARERLRDAQPIVGRHRIDDRGNFRQRHDCPVGVASLDHGRAESEQRIGVVRGNGERGSVGLDRLIGLAGARIGVAETQLRRGIARRGSRSLIDRQRGFYLSLSFDIGGNTHQPDSVRLLGAGRCVQPGLGPAPGEQKAE